MLPVCNQEICLWVCVQACQFYYVLIVERTHYTIHIVYNLLHVMLDGNLILYGIVMYYLYVYAAVESGINQFN